MVSGSAARWPLATFPRLRRLREALLVARTTLCVERARLWTEHFKEQGFDRERPLLRQARALSYVLDNLPPVVFDDELIVGSTTQHRLGALIFPEFMSMVIWPELPTLAQRAHDPVQLDPAHQALLGDEIFPFWKDLTVHEHARVKGDNPESLRLLERMVFYLLAKSNGITHIIPDYATVVRRGLAALSQEALQRSVEATDPEAAEFHQATHLSLEAVIRFAGRYAAECRRLSKQVTRSRALELLTIAEALERVPAQPAKTMHEALQSIWLVQVALHQENNDLALSFGRLDQILWPLYQADLLEGRLDPAGAAELLGAFFIKMGDHTPLVPSAAQKIFGGSATNQAVTIGGLTPDGDDGVNPMTMLALNVSELLALREPNLCARLHHDSPASYRRALVDSIYRTGAAPALYGDEAVIEALCAHGVSLEHARDYGVIGCVEPTNAGRTCGMTGAILFNLAAVLELTLNDGVHPLSGLQVGPRTGKLAALDSAGKLRAAFERQLDHLVTLACDGNTRLARAHAELHPTPLLSALIEGTAESGRDITRGGARYNSSGVAIVGLADVADSLTAIEQLVFEGEQIELAELGAALVDDFCGHERTRALLRSRASRYGTDDARADRTTIELIERVAESFDRHPTPRDGRYQVGYWTLTMHTGFGALTGALPSGRRRGRPLASGATPVAGAATAGPTAALASTAALPARLMANGIANNHKLPRGLLAQPGKLELMNRLVEVFFARGGMQLQYTVQDRQDLLEAQQDPDAHRDLLVRVSGYTAYFCQLNRAIQDEIIARTEDRL